MTTLLLPVAGRSSRFPGMRPKWLLTMPDGKLMLEKSVSLLNLNEFSKIVIICLREHISEYLGDHSIEIIIKSFKHENVELCILDQPTFSQSETIAKAITNNKISGPIYIKDCDNMFASSYSGGNEISVINLNNVGLMDAKNKSYVQINELGHVSNIVEKQIISNLFCCGGYGFSEAESFMEHFERIPSEKEVYISNVIYSMIVDGGLFCVNAASKYVDWGTLREYQYYTQSFLTIFCDVDGVIFKNGSKHGKLSWNTAPIISNLEAIKKLQDEGKIYFVITSSRPVEEFSNIQNKLLEIGIKIDDYLMGLPHSKRVLINDYSNTNPYPSAIAINIERDSEKLSSLIHSLSP